MDNMYEGKSSQSPVRTTLYLPAGLHRRAKIYAAQHGTSVSAMVVKGLKAQLKEAEGGK